MHTTSTTSNRIHQEQIRLLYRSTLRSVTATAVAAYFLAFLQWPYVHHTIILTWLSAVSLVLIYRVYLYNRYKQKHLHIPAHIWEEHYVFTVIVAGIIWGAAGIWLLPQEHFEAQAITIIILTGLAAGAMTAYAVHRLAAHIFIGLSLTPLILSFIIQATPMSLSFAFMSSIFMLFLIVSAKDIHFTHLENIALRIKSEQREEKLQRSNTFIQKTAEILELIAKGEPAETIYNAIALLYESKHAGLRCSMLELKNNKLMHGGAPSLPQSYCDAVNGLENGACVGSCGTSTFTGKRVLVEDIATDPKWEKLKDFALPHGLRSCWSEPIKDKHGKVLGAFGMYYNHPALPNKEELADLQSGARLAGIVMEREKRECLLQKLHSAFNHVHDAIMIADLDARLEYVNPAFEAMTGYSAQEAVGQFISILRSDKHPPSFYSMLEAQDKAGEYWQGELIIKRKDGSFLEVERTVSPVFDHHGKPIFLVAIQRDLTEHKALEAKFLQAQKMEAIGTLVGGIAHDFNNILAGILGNAYLLRTKVDQTSDAVGLLERIEQSSERAADLIQQMLTFARKDSVNMKPLNLSTLIQKAFKLIRSSIPENIETSLTINHKNIHIQGDKTQVHQILLNLVNNARDALNQQAQPSIVIDIDMQYIGEDFVKKHPYAAEGDYARLRVQDNGCGIPQDDMKHLFEPFFTTKEVGKGTGLGLAMVFGAVKRHHGFIEVSSDEGSGTTFDVYLPCLAEVQVEPQEKTEPVAHTQGNQEMILLVDDEPMILNMGTEVLETLGYRVLQAKNGKEAVQVFKQHQQAIHLVVSDIVMPKLGGIEAVAQMRQINPSLKAIFCTGYDDKNITHHANIQDGDAVLRKPYKITDLSKLVAQVLQRN